MQNPLTGQYNEAENRQLVEAAVSGDRSALDQLVKLHQPFIYNVAWKMVHDANDALDLTQETLLKVITKLALFQGKSSFRTWLYRIVMNEFLMGKRRKTEDSFSSFADYGAQLDAVPNSELTREEEIAQEELSREMKIRCMSGMLMCLTREQRLIYILGDSFGIDHNVGAEIFEVSPQNFRVKLHRARKELYNYMNNKCGLVNKTNPCRCPKKARTLKKMGALDEGNMQFNVGFKSKIAAYATEHHAVAGDAFEEKYTELFRDHPARRDFDKQTVIDEILENDELMRYFK
ncbi:RNA polymerase sigma factor [Lewinella sp. 4G2]|uniref:RNA polymerase sigma factor n=1 Tax=Lewinella sp. 4G2 TaxID=1803372 RepID=UPI0007B4C0FB|nr:RNA polymerase sigma factor [Lewinella sp. 4G2]OAV45177.1 RNA polymerase subunit sigma-70 [Lewinella sp. 4G2]